MQDSKSNTKEKLKEVLYEIAEYDFINYIENENTSIFNGLGGVSLFYH